MQILLATFYHFAIFQEGVCCGQNWLILPNFFAKYIFYICDEAAKFVWCGLEAFYPPKQRGKLTLGVFQDLLSNSVNFESLFYY